MQGCENTRMRGHEGPVGQPTIRPGFSFPFPYAVLVRVYFRTRMSSTTRMKGGESEGCPKRQHCSAAPLGYRRCSEAFCLEYYFVLYALQQVSANMDFVLLSVPHGSISAMSPCLSFCFLHPSLSGQTKPTSALTNVRQRGME